MRHPRGGLLVLAAVATALCCCVVSALLVARTEAEKLMGNWPWGEFAEGHLGPGKLRKSAPKGGGEAAVDAHSFLFEPLTIRNVTLKNRVAASPMCQYSSEDGFVHDWHLVHLGSFANGGAGLVILAVEPRGRLSPWDAGTVNVVLASFRIYCFVLLRKPNQNKYGYQRKDEHIPGLKRIVDYIHTQHSAACLQIAHGGRKASTWPPHITFKQKRAGIPDDKGGWEVVGPSVEPWASYYKNPHELSKDEIYQVTRLFGEAAERAVKAGFDALEINGAHGYLISSFNSPITNKRTDITAVLSRTEPAFASKW